MAGKRMIHDNVCESRKVNKVSFEAEALWFRMQTKADDNGNYYRDNRRVYANCMLEKSGATEALVEKWLKELVKVGLLIEYEADGRKYVHVTDFHKYQSFRQDRPVTVEYPVHPESAEPTGYQKTGIAQQVRREVATILQPTDNQPATNGRPEVEVEVKGEGKGKGNGIEPALSGNFKAFGIRFSQITGVTLPGAKQVKEQVNEFLVCCPYEVAVEALEEWVRQRGGRDRVKEKPQYAWKNFHEAYESIIAGLRAPSATESSFPVNPIPD